MFHLIFGFVAMLCKLLSQKKSLAIPIKSCVLIWCVCQLRAYFGSGFDSCGWAMRIYADSLLYCGDWRFDKLRLPCLRFEKNGCKADASQLFAFQRLFWPIGFHVAKLPGPFDGQINIFCGYAGANFDWQQQTNKSENPKRSLHLHFSWNFGARPLWIWDCMDISVQPADLGSRSGQSPIVPGLLGPL